ncbi:hypothetical protein ANN_18509 [Periplaneta americana]|uniref:DUF4817 domain-containing protein n=1 Tax=Periplaneta americana TaxID=6978 RepID=A0ABQ8SPZ4_PERAM|nr:hypothetical protein ANN_18509 [Periplaneta americana]
MIKKDGAKVKTCIESDNNVKRSITENNEGERSHIIVRLFASSCHHHQGCGVVLHKMATLKQGRGNVLRHGSCTNEETSVAVQRKFRTKFGKDATHRNCIAHWVKQFENNDCLCPGKSPGRLQISEERVNRIRAVYERSPSKAIKGTSRELQVSQSTVLRPYGSIMILH